MLVSGLLRQSGTTFLWVDKWDKVDGWTRLAAAAFTECCGCSRGDDNQFQQKRGEMQSNQEPVINSQTRAKFWLKIDEGWAMCKCQYSEGVGHM